MNNTNKRQGCARECFCSMFCVCSVTYCQCRYSRRLLGNEWRTRRRHEDDAPSVSCCRCEIHATGAKFILCRKAEGEWRLVAPTIWTMKTRASLTESPPSNPTLLLPKFEHMGLDPINQGSAFRRKWSVTRRAKLLRRNKPFEVQERHIGTLDCQAMNERALNEMTFDQKKYDLTFASTFVDTGYPALRLPLYARLNVPGGFNQSYGGSREQRPKQHSVDEHANVH